ncbi:MAG: TlpA disulfide reductase family protein, partial [Odoribacter sp.]
MKYILLFFVLQLMGCGTTIPFVMKGDVEATDWKTIYLYRIENEYYRQMKVIDSAEVCDGHFRFERAELPSGLYFLGNKEEGGKVFLEPGQIKVKGVLSRKKNVDDEIEELKWKVEGCEAHQLYVAYLSDRYEKTGQRQLDSLDELFFAAREKEDSEEMARIKEASIRPYERADSINIELVKQLVETNYHSPFAIYLYAKNLFSQQEFHDTLTIRKTVAYINNTFGEKARNSVYYDRLIKKLNKADRCAIGRLAIEIIGLDTLGKELKLSDLRGKYVLVDFWNSYCHWCREESPNMRRALAECGDRFTILGVS